MANRLTSELVRSAAAMIDLPVTDGEVSMVQERLQLLLDGTAQFAHLVDDTAELDLRFNASWEHESV